MKKIFFVISLIVACSLILLMSARGLAGNPNENQINTKEWKENGPFELSPERGRFALAYSIIENGSVHFSLPLARFVTPDVAYHEGKYVSLFPPATSYLIIPGYVIGKALGASQVGAFFIISVIAIFNILLIRAIVNKLVGKTLPGTIAGLLFLFATPAFSYAVNLYQHHITTFIILSSIYLLMKSKSIISIGVVLFLCALSIPVDNPNAIFLFPIGFYAITRLVDIEKVENYTKLHVRYLGVFSLLLATIPLLLLLIYNTASHNQALKLSGTLSAAKQIDENGLPLTAPTEPITNIIDNIREDTNKKTASGFFKTRDLMNGFYVHLFSPDRGVIFYTPVVLFGLWGFVTFPKNQRNIKAVIAGTMAAIFLLYSLWGDPWGGWAFGDRYMIPAYALLCIFLGTALRSISKNYLIALIFSLVVIYSVAVNTLGAVTTSANPSEGEAKALSEISKREEKYGYDRNWQYLNASGSKSFFYKTHLSTSMTPQQFYITIVILNLMLILPLYFYFTYKVHKSDL